MRQLLLALALVGCVGPLKGMALVSPERAEAQTLLSLTVPSLDLADGVVRGWGGGEPVAVRETLLGLFGVAGSAVTGVAGERPMGMAVVRAARPGADGGTGLGIAIALTLRDPEATADWLAALGTVVEHRGELWLIQRRAAPISEGRRLTVVFDRLWAWARGGEVVLSGCPDGLTVAGSAARAAAHAGGAEIVARAYPARLARDQRTGLMVSTAEALDRLRFGRARHGFRSLPARLSIFAAETVLQPIVEAAQIEVHLALGPGGAEMRLRTTAPHPSARGPLRPALDLQLVGNGPAALGVLDCRDLLQRRERWLATFWRDTEAPGADELMRLDDLEEKILDGSCSFAVHTDDDLWSESASWPFRAGAAPAELSEALVAAIRSGSLPGLASAADDLVLANVLFTRHDDVLAVDRVLAPGRLETRRAAALIGESTWRDRFAVRPDRLLVVSGAHADARLAALNDAPGALPPLLAHALSDGRGKAGFLFADLAALWKPLLKAGQATDSPIAALVARNPSLVERARPLVVTLEPASGLEATATLAPETFRFLVRASVVLLGR